MSILIKLDDKVVLLCKGADDILKNLLEDKEKELYNKM